MKLSVVAAAAGIVPIAAAIRGVPPEKEHLYVPDKAGQWACLTHPEIKLSFDQVNDDYCDCPDGSDEPGTAACPGNLFYCANKGHIPAYIPSSRVNDGVCDYDVCCDGSDEAGLDPSLCPDRCKEIHEAYEKDRYERVRQLTEGLKEREKIVAKAKQDINGLQKELKEKESELSNKRATLEQDKVNLETAIEEDRARKLKMGISADQLDTPPEIAEIATELLALAERNEKGVELVNVLVNQYNDVSETFERLKVGYNPNFNDPAVKEAIRSWDDIKKRQDSFSEIQGSADQLKQLITRLEAYRPSASSNSNNDACECPSYSDYLSGLPQPFNQIPLLLDSAAEQLEKWGLYKRSTTRKSGSGKPASDESEEVTSIRRRVENTENEISTLSDRINAIKKDLATNYGNDDVLRGLKNVCVKNHIGEYDYEVCFYGGSTQSGNGQYSNLGSYDNVEINADGTLQMHYERGARCWNGPIRRSVIDVRCGSKNEILSVSEPEKCEYFFKMTSPAACQNPDPMSDPESESQPRIVHGDL
ncbi:hypothetical protein TRVA0_007S02058 [Trichomonascus vanleenenianus]|uniref:Gtb1p n=1 Tax=Trichomonascus vanleenenianus TaxID=2268995 RepID=UPI003EC96D6F